MMGEQGAESIHATFNKIELSYRNMIHNRIDRLKECGRAAPPANLPTKPGATTWDEEEAKGGVV